ncbi:MAG: deoxyribose-phosphate aldolase [Syntrophomonadaceae bacterium]|nr:deoxyribose-phosphate aldolase [Syntrophomonadaceae bacterium]
MKQFTPALSREIQLTPQHIDQTLLRPEATRRQVEELCAQAKEIGFAAVCIFPQWVSLASQLLTGSPVKVCTVVGFPFGSNTQLAKTVEAAEALARGAEEIDLVMNLGAFKSRDLRRVSREIEAVAELVSSGKGGVLKVILETGLLEEAEMEEAARLAEEAGAHFVKTSTGFGPGGARAEDVRRLRQVLRPTTRIKASGGIRTVESAISLRQAGADRLGTSAGVEIVRSLRQTGGIL